MLIDLTGRTALTTGGSQGLGRQMALRFAASGADLVLWARDRAKLSTIHDEIRSLAPNCRVHTDSCDVSVTQDIEAAWERLPNDMKAIDILINNAGSTSRKPFTEISRHDLVSDVDLKLTAALRLSQLAAEGMRERRWGRIVNIVSTSGKTPAAGRAPTTVVRAAGLALTKVMAGELAPYNVLVNALCIGKILSEQWPVFHQEERPDLSYDEYLAQQGKNIPLRRMGRGEELANAACFLVSEQASYITGAALNVDGGLCPVL